MDIFRNDGHLRREAIEAMARGGDFTELERLEWAEHLACCDRCLQRYTEALAGAELLTPSHSCRRDVLRRARMRALQLLTSRYATAAAAVALALTLVWGGERLPALSPEVPWTEVCTAALDSVQQTCNDFFDGLEDLRPHLHKEDFL